jgi:hypothetical protein
MWITEDGTDLNAAQANGMPAADFPELQAKAALRFFAAYASEGAQAIDLFAAKGGSNFQLIPQSFFDAVDANPSSYPSGMGGPTMTAVSRMVATLNGAQNIAHPRQLTLNAVASDNNTDVQFTGNGTPTYPNLYNRNVLAFFPFQVSQNKFVSAVYVMSSDVTHRYTQNPPAGHTPYDMPPENYQLTIGNVNAATATVSLTDPLTGTSQPATIVSRTNNQIVIALQATDSPRMLTINDGRKATHHQNVAHHLSLVAPSKLPLTAAVRHGVKLEVRCSASCAVSIQANPAGPAGVTRRVLGRARARTVAHRMVPVTLQITRAGRLRLRMSHILRLRVTARAANHSATKIVRLSVPTT